MSFFNKQMLRMGVRVVMAFLFTGTLSAGDPKGGETEGSGGPLKTESLAPSGESSGHPPFANPNDDSNILQLHVCDLEFVTSGMQKEGAGAYENGGSCR